MTNMGNRGAVSMPPTMGAARRLITNMSAVSSPRRAAALEVNGNVSKIQS